VLTFSNLPIKVLGLIVLITATPNVYISSKIFACICYKFRFLIPEVSTIYLSRFCLAVQICNRKTEMELQKIYCSKYIKTLLLPPHCFQHLYRQLNVGQKILNMFKICLISSAVLCFLATIRSQVTLKT